MKKLALASLLVAATVAAEPKGKPVTVKVPPLPPSTTDLLITDPAHAAFVPSEKMGMRPGSKVALIGQDPVSTGPTTYMKLPAGYLVPLHWHTHGERLFFISGKAALTVDGKPYALEAGSYVSLPPKSRHELACAAGAECLIIIERSGPTDVNWVKK